MFSSPGIWVVGPYGVYIYGCIEAKFECISSHSGYVRTCSIIPTFPKLRLLLSLLSGMSCPLLSIWLFPSFMVCDMHLGIYSYSFRGLCHPNRILIFPTVAPTVTFLIEREKKECFGYFFFLSFCVIFHLELSSYFATSLAFFSSLG